MKFVLRERLTDPRGSVEAALVQPSDEGPVLGFGLPPCNVELSLVVRIEDQVKAWFHLARPLSRTSNPA